MFKEKWNAGKQKRKKIPRESHAYWKPGAERPSIIDMIKESNNDRLTDLIPLRHLRMSESPFVFYRATALIMARDLYTTPSTGILVQANGDCHLKNIGGFATPERNLVIDMNDFDETYPAHFEWDVKRLATSFFIAALENGLSESDAEEITNYLLTAYAGKMVEFSQMNLLDLWYLKFDLQEMQREAKNKKAKKRLADIIKKSPKKDNASVFYKMINSKDGKFTISENPPYIRHPFDMKDSMQMLTDFFDRYKSSLQPDKKFLLEKYKLIDVALKVVGVGSIGTRCFIALLLNDNNEPLFIQVKEARKSVLEPYSIPEKYTHQGERVVRGQKLIQNASDIFLGWSTSDKGRHYYYRQLKDKKISVELETHDKYILTVFADCCANVLARAHCKTGQGAVISGYIGKGDAFVKAITIFAKKYSQQTEKDFKEFVSGIRSGHIQTA